MPDAAAAPTLRRGVKLSNTNAKLNTRTPPNRLLQRPSRPCRMAGVKENSQKGEKDQAQSELPREVLDLMAKQPINNATANEP